MTRALALCGLLTALLPSAAPAAEAGENFMAHERAAASVTDLKPELVIYGGLYSGAFTTLAGVTCDPVSDEIYAADAGASRIEIFDARGAPLFEFTDAEHLTEPSRLAVDGQGRIYVLDLDRTKVKVFSYRGDYLGPLVVPGYSDGTQSFTAILFDAEGDLYLGESKSGQVLVVELPSLKVKRRIGTFGDDRGQLDGIVGIAVDAERVYVASQNGVAVHVFSKYGRLLRAWGYHDAGTHNVSLPSGIAVDAAGRIVLADTLRQELKYFAPDGKFIDMFGGLGAQPGQIAYPSDLSMDRRGRLCVADRGNDRIQLLSPVEADPDDHPPGEPGGAQPGSPEPSGERRPGMPRASEQVPPSGQPEAAPPDGGERRPGMPRVQPSN